MSSLKTCHFNCSVVIPYREWYITGKQSTVMFLLCRAITNVLHALVLKLHSQHTIDIESVLGTV